MSQINELSESYELSWSGKTASKSLITTPLTTELVLQKDSSSNNWYIEGDNLEALKHLRNTHEKKIKMIYIDPPYNTGKSFVYTDNFRTGKKNKRYGNNLVRSDKAHASWLSFIYPRIALARDLLTQDGVIFIHIDRHEKANLRIIMDEIFGSHNYVGELIRRTRTSFPKNSHNLTKDYDFIICYKKTSKFKGFLGSNKLLINYKNPDEDPRGDWKKVSLECSRTASQCPNQFYDILNPKTGKLYPCNRNRVWRFIKPTLERLIEEDKIIFPEDSSKCLTIKQYKNEVSLYTQFSQLLIDSFNAEGTTTIQELFGFKAFDFPKPVSLIKILIEQTCNDGDTVLDFFGGSSTTAHAVLQYNHEKNINLNYILVQLPEPCNEHSEASHYGFKTISDIGKERIRLADQKINQDTPKGFNSFKLKDLIE